MKNVGNCEIISSKNYHEKRIGKKLLLLKRRLLCSGKSENDSGTEMEVLVLGIQSLEGGTAWPMTNKEVSGADIN